MFQPLFAILAQADQGIQAAAQAVASPMPSGDMLIEPINLLIPPVTLAVTEGVKFVADKLGFGASDRFQRLLPIIPQAVAFGLTFIPGLGMEKASAVVRIGFAFGSGSAAGWAHKFFKQTVKGGV